MAKNLDDSIAQLQLLQQRAAVFSSQKQQLQLQRMEVNTALKEISSTKKPVYRLMGGILVEKPADNVKKDLSKVKKDLELRIKTLEKQEEKTQSKIIELQGELSKELKAK